MAPYTPVTVPALTGAPTVMNGEVKDEDDIPHNTVKEYPILRVEEGGTLENAPAYVRPRGSKWFAEWSADNTQLNLAYHDGFCILIR